MKAGWRWVGLLLVAAVAVGCGTRGATPAAPAAPTAPAAQEQKAPAAQPEATGDRYAAVAERSEAAYAVREKFLGNELNVTAVGKTSTLSGQIILKDGVIQPSTVQVDVSKLKSDEDRRDNQVRRALDTGNHPLATYKITGAEGNPVIKEGAEVSLKLLGSMTIKGSEQPLTFDATARLVDGVLTLTAQSLFKMTTFGVNPPSVAGFVSVTDEVTLTVNFVGAKQ